MKASLLPDYYQLLGLTPSASATELKARYRTLSKQHHPDRGGSQVEMAKINQAYAVLADAFKRKIYDAERRRHVQAELNARYVRKATAARQASTPKTTAESQFAPPSKKHNPWWAKLILGFASLVLIGGVLLHLPVAEAISSNSSTTDTAATKSLDVTYPPENTPVTPSAPSTLTTPTSQPTPQPATPTSTDTTTNELSEIKNQRLHESCALVAKNVRNRIPQCSETYSTDQKNAQ